MGILPYWDRDVDVDVVPWLPYALDFSPVSINAMHSERLRTIAAMAMEVGSEFLYLKSSRCGRIGALFPENLIDPGRAEEEKPGFVMVFAYSKLMETLTYLVSEAIPGMKAGLALCGLWNDGRLIDEFKVIAFANENPFFDEEPFLEMLQEILKQASGETSLTAFYAERFGYRRATIPYETDDVTQLAIAQLLFEFELDETRRIVGPPPQVELSVLGKAGQLALF